MSNNATEIKLLEEKIAELKAQDDAFAALDPEQRLAITLHDLFCHHNHVDQCGWAYEFFSKGMHDWGGHEHGAYMQKALNIHTFCRCHGLSTDSAVDLLRLAKGI